MIESLEQQGLQEFFEKGSSAKVQKAVAYVIEQGRVVHQGRSEDLAHDPVIVSHYLGPAGQAA